MLKFPIACALLIFAMLSQIPALATSYYVANSGSDINNGTDPSTPWKTMGKVNSITAALQPGDTVFFHRGDIWRDDYLKCLNIVSATSSTTLLTNPPSCSGSSSAQVTFDAYGTGSAPLIDGADRLNLAWTQIKGTTTYSAALALTPSKLYVDNQTVESTPLLPVTNSVGAYVSGRLYNFLDVVTYNGHSYVYGNPISVLSASINDQSYWYPFAGSTKTGLAAVESLPGSWYYGNGTIYANLADGSSPALHVIEGTYRPYGVMLESVNYVTVASLGVGRVAFSGIAAVTNSDPTAGGSYWTNEFNTFVGNQVWNVGSIVQDCLPYQYGQSGHPGCYASSIVSGILSHAFRSDSNHNSQALRGTVISGNITGRTDNYLGFGGTGQYWGGITAVGQSGVKILFNKGASVNGACMIHSNTDLSSNDRNVGGEMGNNVCTNSQGNFFFSSSVGGRLHDNFAHESYGEGVQIGGGGSGTLIDHNLIANIGKSASGGLYNGIDCNGGGDGMQVLNNTIYNTWGSGPTLETGCTNYTLENNIVSQNGKQFPQLSALNGSDLVSWHIENQASAMFDHNMWQLGAKINPFNNFPSGPSYECQGFFSLGMDTNSSCADPQFVNPGPVDGTANFHLLPTSPAIGAGIGGSDLGALPYGVRCTVPAAPVESLTP